MKLTINEKRKIETITKKVFAMLPYAILIIVSIIFVSSYGNSNDILMRIIKVCLLIFNIFAIYALTNKIIDFIRFLTKK